MDNTAEARHRALQYKELLERHSAVATDVVWDSGARTWDLELRYRGAHLVLVVDADDPGFVCILMPHFWWFRPEELPAVLQGIEAVNRTCKCGKVHVSRKGDGVTASVEFLDTQGHAGAPDLWRYLDMARAAAQAFVECWQPDRPVTATGQASWHTACTVAGDLSAAHADDTLH